MRDLAIDPPEIQLSQTLREDCESDFPLLALLQGRPVVLALIID